MLRYKLVQRKDMTKGALENAKLYYIFVNKKH